MNADFSNIVNFSLKQFCPNIEKIEQNTQNVAFFNFVKNAQFDKTLPLCGISLLNVGSMRFRWNEINPNREKFFTNCGIDKKNIVPVELIHSKKVCAISSNNFNFSPKIENLSENNFSPKIENKNSPNFEITRFSQNSGVIADGVICKNSSLVPCVTVADCMPLYLFNPVLGVAGVVHSGWKGTGIVEQAIKLAKVLYNAKAEDFCVVIGPCIGECCYNVDENRAKYFSSNFGSECVTKIQNPKNLKFPFQLSLRKANLLVLQKIGVKKENIAVCTDCTSCSTFLGSHRRETKNLAENIDLETRLRSFTPMLAFLKQE